MNMYYYQSLQVDISEICQRGITTKLHRRELRYLCYASRLMVLHISMKFHENILKGFQVIKRTRNDHFQILKGTKYKTVYTIVTILVFCTLSDNALHFYEVS